MMRRVLGLALGLLAYLAFGLAIAPFAPSGAIAQVSPPCGTPAWTASPGAAVNAANINSELNHLESCAGSAALGGGGSAAPNITPSAPIVATTSGTGVIVGLGIVTTTGACLDVAGGLLQYDQSVCPTAGPQATPSTAASDSALVMSGSFPYVIGFNSTQPDAITWNNFQNFNYTAGGGCDGGSSPTAPVCILTSATVGLAMGPTSGVWTGGSATSNSAEIAFCKSVSGTITCPGLMFETSGGSLEVSGSPFVAGGGQSITASGYLSGASLHEAAANDIFGTCTFSSSTTCTQTVPSLATPVCVANSQAHTYTAECSVSGTTLTITSGTSNSDTWTFIVGGNPS